MTTPSSPVLLVTGAGGQLGQAVVQCFRQAGYRIAGTLYPGGNTPDSKDPDIRLVNIDLLNGEVVQAFVNETAERLGRIDAAVLTAGGFAMGSVLDSSTAGIREQYQLNFETAFNAARPLFRQMLKQGQGRIFFMGSRAGLSSEYATGLTAYSLSKSLLFRLAEMMNREAQGTGVVTTVVVPSIIDTPANRAAMPEADFSAWVKPDEIARIILYHCGTEAAALREPLLKIYGNS